MLRSPFHAGTSADAQEPGEKAAPSQSSTVAGVWAEPDPQTDERLKPPAPSRREQPQRNSTAQASEPAHPRRSTDLLGLNVEPLEPWQRAGGASNAGQPSMDDWLPPLPKARPAAAGAQSGLKQPPQASAYGQGPAAAQHGVARTRQPAGTESGNAPASQHVAPQPGAASHVQPGPARAQSRPGSAAPALQATARSQAQPGSTQAPRGGGRSPDHLGAQPGSTHAPQGAGRSTGSQGRGLAGAQTDALHRPLPLGVQPIPAQRSVSAGPSPLPPRASAPAHSQPPHSQGVQRDTSATRSPQAGVARAHELHATEPEPIRSRAQSAEMKRAPTSQPPAAATGDSPIARVPSSPAHPRVPAQASVADRAKSRAASPEPADKWAWARSAQSDLTSQDAQNAQQGAATPTPLARRGLASRAVRLQSDLTLPNVPIGVDPTSAHKPSAPSSLHRPQSSTRRKTTSAQPEIQPSARQTQSAAPSQTRANANESHPTRNSRQPTAAEPQTPGNAAKPDARKPQITTPEPTQRAPRNAAQPQPFGAIPDLSQSQAPRSAARVETPSESRAPRASSDLTQSRPPRNAAPGQGSASNAEQHVRHSVPDPQSHSPRGAATTHAAWSAPNAELHAQGGNAESRAPRNAAPVQGSAPNADLHARPSVPDPQSRLPRGAATTHSARSASDAEPHAQSGNAEPRPRPRATTQGPWSTPSSAIPELSQSRPPRGAVGGVSISQSRAVGAASEPIRSREMRRTVATHVPGAAAPSYLSVPPVAAMSESHAAYAADVVDSLGSRGALAESRVPEPVSPAPQAQSELIELRALREADEQHEQGDTPLAAPRLRLDDTALWSSSLHSAQVAYGRDAVRGSLELDEPEHTPPQSLRLGSQRVTEPLTMMRRAAWSRWLRAALGGVVLGAVASVAVGYSAVWMPWMPRAEQLPVRLTAEPADGPREAVDVLPPGEESSASAALDPAVRPGPSPSQPTAAAAADSERPAKQASAEPDLAAEPGDAARQHSTAPSQHAGLQPHPERSDDAPSPERAVQAEPGSGDSNAADLRARSAQPAAEVGAASNGMSASALAAQRADAVTAGAANAAPSAQTGTSATGAVLSAVPNTEASPSDSDSVSVGAQPRAASAHPGAREPVSVATVQPPAAPAHARVSQPVELPSASASTRSSAREPVSVTTVQPPAAPVHPGVSQPVELPSASASTRSGAREPAPPSAGVNPAPETPPLAAAAHANTASTARGEPASVSAAATQSGRAEATATLPPAASVSSSPAPRAPVTSAVPDTTAAMRNAGPPPSAAFAALDEALGTKRAAPVQSPPPPAATPGPQPVLMVRPLTAAASDGAPALPEQPSREQVRDTMLAMHSTMAACAAGKHGTTFANVTVQGDGRVSYSLIEGAFAGTGAGSCMARALRSATFPPFAGPPFKVRYPLVF